MNKPTVRKTKEQPQLRELSEKLDVIGDKLDELLRRVPPKPLLRKSEIVAAHNEPVHKPSSRQRSLSTRSEAELHELAFGPSTSGEPQVQTNPMKHPTLGSL